MSRKCRAFSKSKLGIEPADNRKAFYAGWEAALAEQKCPCGDRPAEQCLGEWEPGCDMGSNPKYAKVAEPAPQQEVQEPVYEMHRGELCYRSTEDDQSYGMLCPVNDLPNGTKLYTHPAPVREPLTPEQIKELRKKQPSEDLCGWSYEQGIKSAEAEHGITKTERN